MASITDAFESAKIGFEEAFRVLSGEKDLNGATHDVYERVNNLLNPEDPNSRAKYNGDDT